MTTIFADRFEMQNRLFAELSAMFGREVPLYDRALLVNRASNEAVCGLVAKLHPGLSISSEQLARTSGERHGAIRIGRADEYKWVARFFAAFGMEPHNFYDMTAIGAKSQPIIATAFRSVHRPEHRVFTSLLMTDYFAEDVRKRIEGLLAKRSIFSDRAKQLIQRCEEQGGLSMDDSKMLIREGVDHIFKWTGKARDHQLYKELSDAGFKIAADIACFQSHHLNHLTPNTLLMDLYTASMKYCMGGIDERGFRQRATAALGRLAKVADRHWMRLHFKHLSHAEIDSYQMGTVSVADIAHLVDGLVATFKGADYQLSALKHSGYKDFTEGPSEDTPILLRQDAYKALTEAVEFLETDGSTVAATHTARFGEIEERGYACTPAGRKLYDECLAKADTVRDADPGLALRDFAAYDIGFAAPFAPFPKTLPELLRGGFVYGRFAPTPQGVTAAKSGLISTTDLLELVERGFAQCEGLRYEDFLPVSAAGIFASNLNQYGTKSSAAVKPTYSQKQLEEIMGRPVIDATVVYAAIDAASRIDTLQRLHLLEKLPPEELRVLRAAVAACPGGLLEANHAMVGATV